MQNQNCNILQIIPSIYSFGSNVEDISSKLQGALDSILPWYMSNRLNIDANKCIVMLIDKPSQVDNDLDIKINGTRTEQVQSIK